jgi:N-acyl-D-amino-acid deacylase
MHDLIVKNATVVDGSGAPAFRADVAVSGGKIELVGDCTRNEARRVIDASARVVSPGFIDMHSHSDVAILVNPRQESKIMQGVTTEVIGQDGLSYAPVNAATLSMLRRNLSALNGDWDSISWDWTSVGDYLSRFDGKVAVNICYLIPHAAIRLLVVGPQNRKATDDELELMRTLVAEGMREGAVGFSTGLTYTPCAFSDTRELTACCQGVAPFGGYFAPHLRSYGARFREAIDEALNVGHESGVPVHFTHFHSSYEINRDRAEELLGRLDQAKKEGMDITLDSYPYTAASTFLAGFFPSWVHAGGPEDFLSRISSHREKERIRRELEEEGCDGYSHVLIDWSKIVISSVASQRNQWSVGRPVSEVAREKNKSPFDWVCELLHEENLQVSCLALIGHEKNVQTIMKCPYHMVGTDGLLTGLRPHPRAYGTFARYLQCYTRELRILTLEECIRKMTSLPAARLGLRDRGLVREGMAADLVIFDYQNIRDTATYENPRSHPWGIDYVLVNGKTVVDGGKHTGVIAGRVLRRHG